MVAISKRLAPVRVNGNSYGRANKKKFLVIHQTGNTKKGANAQMHAQLQINGWDASWHWTVDDKEAVQSFEHDVQCWHASDGRADGNLNSIAIEGCINTDGDYKKSVHNMAELAAKILKDESIPLKNMKQHYDFARDKKNCPEQIRSGKEGIDWNDFVQLVQEELNRLTGLKVESGKVVVQKPVSKPVSKPVAKPKPTPLAKPAIKTNTGGVINMNGTFVANDSILVRNQPTTSATHIATYKKGESLTYEAVHFKNGYVWLQYTRGVGGKGYLPIAPLSEVWGTLK